MQEPKSIVLLGSSRSGTSLFATLMNAHPDIICGSETDFWLSEPKDMSQAAAVVAHRLSLNRWQLDLYELRVRISRAQNIRDIFHAFFMAFAKAHNKSGKAWAEKTVRHLYHIPYINSIFPKCTFIHMVRNGYDNIASKLSGPGFRGDFKKCKDFWKTESALGLKCETQFPARTLRVSYEDLVKNTSNVMNAIFQFCGFPSIDVPTTVGDVITADWQPQKLAYRDEYHQSWYVNHYKRLLREVDQTAIGRHVGILTQQQIDDLANDAEFVSLMHRLGYET